MAAIVLPTAERTLEAYELNDAPDWPGRPTTPLNRIANAAVHVVADPLADVVPMRSRPPSIGTRRSRSASTSGISASASPRPWTPRNAAWAWTGLRLVELIERTLAAARAYDGEALVGCGTGTDQLIPNASTTVDDVIAAYEEQCGAVEAAGGQIVLMASRALAACAKSPDDYARVYGRILSQVKEPVIIHWLGDMFDPALAGYWGHSDLAAAMDVCLAVLADNAAHVDGIKISVLDAQVEIDMRRRLPEGVRMYTGDDFNFAELIAGDEQGYSDALLGIFDVIAPAASAALAELATGNRDRYDEILAPTVPLSRHIFKAPTQFYKTGVVFMAYLNGLQDHFTLVGGQQGARSLPHLCELFRLADRAGLLADPELAVARMSKVLAVHGIDGGGAA